MRVIAATNRNLADMVANGQFREDLLYRLRVIHIHVPPLRERREDIRPLVGTSPSKSGRDVEFSEAALKLIERYRWPGNVRELQNVVEQSLWMSNGARVEVAHLPPSVQAASDVLVPMRERRKQVSDELYTALVSGGYSFWEHIHPLFLARDITRHDMRELVRKGLATTRGNYRALLRLFGMPHERLQALPELPRGTRVHGGLPRVPPRQSAAAPGAAAAAAARGPRRKARGAGRAERPDHAKVS